MADRATKRSARVALPPQPPPDTLQEDVIRICEQIHDIANRSGLTLKQLAKRAGGPFQSFENWKQGHHLPHVANLQAFARAVGANVRLLLQDSESYGGLAMASKESRQIAALIDSVLKDDEEGRKTVLDTVKHFLGSRPHP